MAKILLVEDSEMNRDMLSRRLSRKGFTVVIAIDGKQAVELAKSERPDIILMDLSLPIMDGWEASKAIKQTPETGSIPVIALTAHALAGDREKAIEAGCDDYEIKPLDFPKLLAKIHAFLS
jgi:CheY-like chemotaxis protein